MFLVYLALSLLVLMVGAVVTFLILAHEEIFFAFVETNKWIVILKGKEYWKAIRGDVSQFEETETDERGKVIKTETVTKKISVLERILLYKFFRIRYIGIPFVTSIGTTALHYPPVIESTVPGIHVNGNIISRFDATHTYRLVLPKVEFQTGIVVKLIFNLEILATRLNIAWGKYGRFLDSLAQGLYSRISQIAITTDIVRFIGKTKSDKECDDVARILNDSKSLRELMSAECMRLNKEAGQSNEGIPIDDMSGYSIKAITYMDMEATEEAKARINELDRLAESVLQVQESENRLKISRNDALGAAALTEEELLSEARGSKALLEALGGNSRLMEARIQADGFVGGMKGLKDVSTVFLGGSGYGGQSLVQPVFPVGGKLQPENSATGDDSAAKPVPKKDAKST